MEVFVVNNSGEVAMCQWTGTVWRNWRVLAGVTAAPLAPVGAIAVAPGDLYAFVVGRDGHVYGRRKPHNWPAWNRWGRIRTLKTVLHAPVTPASFYGALHLFATDSQGLVRTTSIRRGAGSQWSNWRNLGLGAPPGAPICAIVRPTSQWAWEKGRLDIFAVGNDEGVMQRTRRWGDYSFGAWKWVAYGLKAPPRSPITALWSSRDRLTLFVVGWTGNIYTTTWSASTQQWSVPLPVGSLKVPIHTKIAAVSMLTNRIDIMVTAIDGRTYSTWYEPQRGWRPWYRMGTGQAAPGTAIAAESAAPGQATALVVGTDGNVWRSLFTRGRFVAAFGEWRRLRLQQCGMSDPRMDQWNLVGTSISIENTDYSHNAQGWATDGSAWYLSSNGERSVRKRVNGAWAWSLGPTGLDSAHIGALGYYDGWLYVPLQHPWGVWKLSATGSAAKWFSVPKPAHDIFPWCNVNPLNGRLYTSISGPNVPQPPRLFAYDRFTLRRHPEDDITLRPPSALHVLMTQGACFTVGGRVLMVRWQPNALYCFSALTGEFFGQHLPGNYGHSDSELESVTVARRQLSGNRTDIQLLELLELTNDVISDCYLHSYHVPDPQRL
jgi:hypothetical protein